MIALDSARRTDENGYLHVEASALTKAAVNPYYGREIPDSVLLGLNPDRIYQVLRPADELEKAVGAFDGLPILIRHEEDSAFDPQKALRVGTTGTSSTWDAPYIRNSIVFHDATAIALIDMNEQKELSAGYRYVPVMESGVFDGQPYELKMTNIRGNHIALVKSGRAGPDVVVADSSPFLRGIAMSAKNKALALAKILMGKGLLAKDEAAAAEVIEGSLVAEDASTPDIATRLGAMEALLNKVVGDAKPAKDEIPAKDEEEEEEEAEDEKDEKPPAKDEKKPLAGDRALKPKPKATPIAMDAARITADITAVVKKQFRDKELAAEAVKPLVGSVSLSACDSAGDIYAFALKQKGFDPAAFAPEAHAGMCAVLASSRTQPLAVDSKPSGVLDGVDLDRFHQL